MIDINLSIDWFIRY